MLTSHSLLGAIAGGIALASLGACGGSTDDPQQSSGGATTNPGNPASTGGDAGLPLKELASLPELGDCTGENQVDAGFGGQPIWQSGPCCEYVSCYETQGASCVPSTEVEALRAEGLFLGVGSGTCGCGAPQGPFNNELAPEEEAGNCCYITRVQDCTGRPLVTQSGWALAEIVPRHDWASSPRV